MSQTTSATTGRRYGLERVCRLWEQSRSALYARRARLQRSASADSPCRRGPTPALSDAQLLAAIRNDLARSPFQGEGHRKVHARLRILDGVRVSRTRVLRVMRAQGLLSPHRGRQGEPKPHDGTIVTSAPDVMWGTDGARVLTVDDGWVWTFAAVDHWNAECVGWHVCKVGDRFAALEPVAQGLRRRCGSVEPDAARGLSLRMDHGSQYLSDHFLNQVRYWGIRPSFGLLKEPETNGVYAWRRRPPSARARADAELRARVQAIHGRSRGTYGAPRIHAELTEGGVAVSRKRVARVMRSVGVAGVSRRRGPRTTRRNAQARPAPDRVERRFEADAPNRLWVADITYVPTLAGFLYLAIVLDVFSRRVVGWAMAGHLRTALVVEALEMAVAQRRPEAVIHHSDSENDVAGCSLMA